MADESTLTAEDRRNASIEANMVAAGQTVEEHIQTDYFGFGEDNVFTFPDGVSTITHSTMNEGKRRQYMNKANNGVTVKKTTGDAHIDTKPGDDRMFLIKAAVTGWNLRSDGQEVRFSGSALDRFLDSANPKIVDSLESAIRKANPWLLDELSVEDIDKEIEDLMSLRDEVEARESGKGDSVTS